MSWQRDASAGPESLESSDDEPLEGHDVAPTARMQQQLQQEMQQQVQQQVQQALVQQGLEPQRKTSKSSKRKKGESSSEAASETASDADSSDDELGLHRERAKKLVPESAAAAAAAAGTPGLLGMYHDLLHLTTLLYAHKASNSQRSWKAIKQEILQQSKTIEVAGKHGWDAARATLEPSKGGAHAVLSLNRKERKRLAAFLKEDKQHKRAIANSGLGKLPYTGHPPKPKDGCWDCGGDHRQADCPRCGRGLPGPPPR